VAESLFRNKSRVAGRESRDLSIEVVFVLVRMALLNVQLHVVGSRISVLAMFAGEPSELEMQVVVSFEVFFARETSIVPLKNRTNQTFKVAAGRFALQWDIGHFLVTGIDDILRITSFHKVQVPRAAKFGDEICDFVLALFGRLGLVDLLAVLLERH